MCSLRQCADVENVGGGFGEVALLRDMKMSAKINAGTDAAQQFQKTGLPAGSARWSLVGDAHRTAMRQQNIYRPFPRDGLRQRGRPSRYILIGDIMRQTVAFRPDTRHARYGEAAKPPPLPLCQQNRRTVPVLQFRKERQVVVVTVDGQDRNAMQNLLPCLRGDLPRIAPIPDRQQPIRLPRIQKTKKRLRLPMQVPDNKQCHTFSIRSGAFWFARFFA